MPRKEHMPWAEPSDVGAFSKPEALLRAYEGLERLALTGEEADEGPDELESH